MPRLDNLVISSLLLFGLHPQNRPANADQTRSSPEQNEIPLDREDQPERRGLLTHADAGAAAKVPVVNHLGPQAGVHDRFDLAVRRFRAVHQIDHERGPLRDQPGIGDPDLHDVRSSGTAWLRHMGPVHVEVQAGRPVVASQPLGHHAAQEVLRGCVARPVRCLISGLDRVRQGGFDREREQRGAGETWRLVET
jgi:hypothetical protein